MTTQVRKSRSGPLKPTPEDLKTAELLDFLSELDNGSEGMTAPRTPSLSGSVTSCEDDEDWDTDERVRRISSQLCTLLLWTFTRLVLLIPTQSRAPSSAGHEV